MMTITRKPFVHLANALVVFLSISSLLNTHYGPRPTFVEAKNYYYTRTRNDPNHLRVSEQFKNKYVHERKFESKINGTKYEYYKSSLTMSHDELVFETIDKIFRHRLSPFYLHHYDNEEDKRLSSDPTRVSLEACTRDLMYLIDNLPKSSQRREPYTNIDEDHLSPELTAFFDSYAKQEAGLLMGNIYWVGAYDQCVNRHIFELTDVDDSPSGSRTKINNDYDDVSELEELNGASSKQVVSFKGRYCVSSLKSRTWDSIIDSRKQSNRNYFKTQRQFDNYSKLFRLQVGICLPDSCDSSSLERHRDEIKLLTTFMLEQRYSDYELIDLYCLPDEKSPLRAWSGSALAFVVFSAFWLTVIFLATLADVFEFVDTSEVSLSPRKKSIHHGEEKCKHPTKLELLVTWFSLRASYRKFMKYNPNYGVVNTNTLNHQDLSTTNQVAALSKEATKQTAAEPSTKPEVDLCKVNLQFLNAFKVIIMLWIVNGHIMLLMIQTAKNILYSDALLNGLMHFLIGATFGVDLFFTMTGFLTAYLLFNSGHAYKFRLGTWIYLTFHRYWRLAPMYLLTFWFSRSVVQLLGSGPLWDYGTSAITFRGLCNQESWWYPLTLTSNLHGLFEECMITSWYISCDMQFWLISPIFIYLLAKKPAHGWIASLATIIMSSRVRYENILAETSARYDELVQPRADIFMRVSHDLPALYTHPHYRVSAFIVGLLAGHYVYMIKSGKWRSRLIIYQQVSGHQQSEQQACKPTSDVAPKVSDRSGTKTKFAKTREGEAFRKRNIMAYTGLVAFLVMSFVSYLLSHYYPTSMLKYAKTVAALAYSIDHLVMSIGASMIIVAMCLGQWSSFVGFLSKPFWTRISKLNYALLLLQCEAIYFQIFSYDQVPVAGTKELINILFNLLVTLYPLSFFVTLTLEFPLASLEKLLL